ncbi:metallophosphoesterase [Devosia ureilytica]|nr:metallophosphoesterase [Devosia ureilytica]
MLKFGRHAPPHPQRQIIVEVDRPSFVYAIGDIHGCLHQLLALEQVIAADIAEHGQSALVVCLGDMIDRGPHSAHVLEHLSTSAPFERLLLTGNHEEMFLDFLEAPHRQHPWLRNGGWETLRSYGLDEDNLFEAGPQVASQRLVAGIGQDHLAMLRNLPVCYALPGLTLVHAGLVEGLPLNQQSARDMVWLRMPEPAYGGPQPFGLVVHGHTPASQPIVEPFRICVDTGAFATGLLTAARIDRLGAVTLFSSRD